MKRSKTNITNSIGKTIFSSTKSKAVRIFEYNLKLYPKSFNGHDSLAEGYLALGDKDKAIKYYELAIELNPGNTGYAKRVLQNSKDKLKE